MFYGRKKAMTIASLIAAEQARQERQLSLIASENYAPREILQITGSVLTNKYAEGYPGKRYYAGCEVIDQIEQRAIDAAKRLFGAAHANVQPHAGSQANLAVYLALAPLGSTILSMDFCAGGHLTHGHPANCSGKLFRFVRYGVHPETQVLDYDEIERLARAYRPQIIIAGASAYSRTIDFAAFARIAHTVGALLVVDMAHIAGLIAAGLHPSPIPHADCVTSTTHKTLRGPRGGFILSRPEHAQAIDRAVMPGIQGGPCMHVVAAKGCCFELAQEPDFKAYQEQVLANARALATGLQVLGYSVVSGGTDTHLLTVDLRKAGLTGVQAEMALEQAGIVVSRSCIPCDPLKPSVASGIRLGTPAMTTRCMGVYECDELVGLIHDVLRHAQDGAVLARVRGRVEALCAKFPAYR